MQCMFSTPLKSKKGIQTPRREMKIIEANFKGLMERIKNRENEK